MKYGRKTITAASMIRFFLHSQSVWRCGPVFLAVAWDMKSFWR
ncbi:MAG: hypothetical protein OEV79_12585 [candidate division WOR-3 bacterium]|nr:hypothetical protein [candidate division WOR-3 bacterium]